MAGLERLLQRLCQTLETHQMGARRLRLTARRVDSANARTEIALARPGRDPARIRALFEPGVARIEAGFGIDALRLEAIAVEPLKPAQVSRKTESEQLADLLSRIGNRIGFENVTRCLPAESHIPERAFTRAAARLVRTGTLVHPLAKQRPHAPSDPVPAREAGSGRAGGWVGNPRNAEPPLSRA